MQSIRKERNVHCFVANPVTFSFASLSIYLSQGAICLSLWV